MRCGGTRPITATEVRSVMELRNRTVWLIGASSGIGAALVPALVAEGAQLALSARDEAALRDIAARCSRPDAPVLVEPLDVTDRAAIERVALELQDAWGRIDVLLYNAGTSSPVDVTAFDVDAFERQIDVNFTGMVRAIGAVLPDMVRRRSGEIVGIGSLSAYGALPGAGAYGATKAAMNYMLQSLRMDARQHGIGVTSVNPGFVRTAMTEGSPFPRRLMLTPETAAHRIIEGMRAGHAEIHFPRYMSLPLKFLTALPHPIYERLVRNLRR